MFQRIIQVIAKALHAQPHEFVMSDTAPFTHKTEWVDAVGEIAIDTANALGVEDAGWGCPLSPYRYDEPECDECYPLFRLRSLEEPSES